MIKAKNFGSVRGKIEVHGAGVGGQGKTDVGCQRTEDWRQNCGMDENERD